MPGAHVFGIECIQLGVDAVIQAIVGQESTERMCRGGKTVGLAARPKAAVKSFHPGWHFSADRFDIGHAKLLERHHQGIRAEQLRHGNTPSKLKPVFLGACAGVPV